MIQPHFVRPCLLVSFALCSLAAAQSKSAPANVARPVPRLNGHPDLTGVWQSARTALSELPPPVAKAISTLQVDFSDVNKEFLDIFWGMKPEDVPMRPETAKMVQEHNAKGLDSPSAECLPTSLPGSLMVLYFKMIQAPKETVMLFDDGDPVRQIFTDGRAMPADPIPSWMGYSVGKWEGDTFVVQTAGFNGRGDLDGSGHPRSDAAKITERYRRRDFGHMDLGITIDDQKYYTRPFDIHLNLTLHPETDVMEYVCNENEKDRVHVRQ